MGKWVKTTYQINNNNEITFNVESLGDFKFVKNVSTLLGTTWEFESGWSVPECLADFNGFAVLYTWDSLNNKWNKPFNTKEIHFGRNDSLLPLKDTIFMYYSPSWTRVLHSKDKIKITFESGTDCSNTNIIGWCSVYGKRVV